MPSKPKYQESEYVQSLTAGDQHVFSAAYNQYYLSIYHFAKKFLDDPQQAEDITADTFVKLWRTAEKEDIQNVKAFLYTAAKNACLDYLKKIQLHAQKQKEILFLTVQENKTAIEIAEVRAEVLKYIYTEIEKLPEKCREIFKLSYIEGLKISEVATQLNLSEQTVSNQKTKALKKLKVALGDMKWAYYIAIISLLNRGL